MDTQDDLTEVTELGGTQFPTMKFVIDAEKGIMALLLPNTSKEAEAIIFEMVTPTLEARLEKEGALDGVPAYVFAEVAREVVMNTVKSKRIRWDDPTKTWVPSGV